MSLDLKLFDKFPPDQVEALPGKMRRAVIDNRKARMTAALVRAAEKNRAR